MENNKEESSIKEMSDLAQSYEDKKSKMWNETTDKIRNLENLYYKTLLVILTFILSLSPFLEISLFVEQNFSVNSELIFLILILLLINITMIIFIYYKNKEKNIIKYHDNFMKEMSKNYLLFHNSIRVRNESQSNLKDKF